MQHLTCDLHVLHSRVYTYEHAFVRLSLASLKYSRVFHLRAYTYSCVSHLIYSKLALCTEYTIGYVLKISLSLSFLVATCIYTHLTIAMQLYASVRNCVYIPIQVTFAIV